MKYTVWMMGLVMGVCATSALGAGAGFKDTFDEEKPDAGAPEGYGVYGVETADRGVVETFSFSGKQAACITVDFTQDKWGVILVKERTKGSWDLTGCELSAQLAAPADLTGVQGMIGFKLVDADGTSVRTTESDLFVPGVDWAEFRQPVSALTMAEEPGKVAGLDLANITQVALVFYDRGDVEKVVNLFVDDVQAAPAGDAIVSSK